MFVQKHEFVLTENGESMRKRGRLTFSSIQDRDRVEMFVYRANCKPMAGRNDQCRASQANQITESAGGQLHRLQLVLSMSILATHRETDIRSGVPIECDCVYGRKLVGKYKENASKLMLFVHHIAFQYIAGLHSDWLGKISFQFSYKILLLLLLLLHSIYERGAFFALPRAISLSLSRSLTKLHTYRTMDVHYFQFYCCYFIKIMFIKDVAQ